MKGKRALVTGASSGIGRVFSKQLAKEGFTVTCVARTEETLQDLVRELGGGHKYLSADLTDPIKLAEVEQELTDLKYDLLINNAGYAIYKRFDEVPLERHENLMLLNMSAVVRLSHRFLKTAESGDALINVSSALSRLSYPGGAVYCGTRGFVTCFTESLWYEHRDRGVYVMALLPGLTRTNFHTVAFEGQPQKMPDRLAYPPEVVVSEAMKILKARRLPAFISGPRYRFMAAIASRFLSRKKIIEMMGKNSPALK